MQSRATRIGLLAVLAIAAVVLFIVLSGNDTNNDTSTTSANGGTGPGVATIRIQNDAPVGGIRELDYSQGDQVRLKVYPEANDVEIHVHGYEIEKKTSGTKPVSLSFPANLAGGFEVEAHTEKGEFQIAELTVNP